MTREYRIIDPLLSTDAADALRRLVRVSGPYGTYVKNPIESGLGAGLTRRHDAVLAFLKRQLASGTLEDLETLAARTNLFRGTWFERGATQGVACESVVALPSLATTAAELLGAALVEPYMLYTNLLLPGQELAVHHDTPEFLGLDKTNTPEWFLVVCGHSGLFEQHHVRVGSAVLFVEGDGALIVYPDGVDAPSASVNPRANTAIVLDADELVHGVARVGGPGADAPPAEVGMQLHRIATGWSLRRGEDEVTRYVDGQVRISLQWKAWLFQDEEERASKRPLTMEVATDRLVEELRRRGALRGERPDDTDLALLLMETFIALPER
ncbi:MAG: hypothetical protein KDA24_04005 [Deltaproteobacteria bacterium]|nr:hypothetical protein [Deltaproteobacteria bacterium]